MSLTSMLADTVDVLDPPSGTVDDLGNPTGSWTITQADRKARVSDLSGADENRVGQQVSFARKVVHLEPAPAVTDRQRIRWDGRDWHIVEVFPVFGRAAVHHLRLIIEEAH